MSFENQRLDDERQLILLKHEASIILENYHDNQYAQLSLYRDMQARHYEFQLEQIIQREISARLEFENQIDHHINMFSNILSVEILPFRQS